MRWQDRAQKIEFAHRSYFQHRQEPHQRLCCCNNALAVASWMWCCLRHDQPCAPPTSSTITPSCIIDQRQRGSQRALLTCWSWHVHAVGSRVCASASRVRRSEEQGLLYGARAARGCRRARERAPRSDNLAARRTDAGDSLLDERRGCVWWCLRLRVSQVGTSCQNGSFSAIQNGDQMERVSMSMSMSMSPWACNRTIRGFACALGLV
jgi:hypothetical protein